MFGSCFLLFSILDTSLLSVSAVRDSPSISIAREPPSLYSRLPPTLISVFGIVHPNTDVETLVSELLIATNGGEPTLEKDTKKKLEVDIGDILIILKAVTTDPFDDRAEDDREWVDLVLMARKALWFRPNREAMMEDLFYRKCQKHKYPDEVSKDKDVEVLNLPKKNDLKDDNLYFFRGWPSIRR